MAELLRSAWCRIAIAAALAAAWLPAQDTPTADVAALETDAKRRATAGDHAGAAAVYAELARAEPDRAAWIVAGADQLGRAGEVDAALDLLDTVADRFERDATWQQALAKAYHLKADTLRSAGQFDSHTAFLYEDARRVAARSVELDPNADEARLIDASASFHLNDVDRALRVASDVVARAPQLYGGHAMVGQVRFQQFVEARQQGADAARIDELRDAARAAFRAAAKLDTGRPLPHQRLGDLDAWSGDVPASLDHYAAALAIDPRAPVNHDWLRQNVEAGARRKFYLDARTRHAARPGSTAASGALIAWYAAQAAFDARDWKTAAAEFGACQQALPDYVDTYWWTLQSQFWGGDGAAAGKTAIAFAERDPRRFADMIRGDDQTIALLVGLASEAYGDNRIPASRELNRVIAYAQQTADAWNNYAFLCRETKQYEESAKAYEFALSLEPDSPQLLNDAALIYQYHLRSEAQLEKAAEYYRRAIEIAEKQLATGNLTGSALERTSVALRDARNNLRALERGSRR